MVSAKGLISHLIIGGLIQPFIDQILSIDSVLGFRLGTENTVVNKKQTGETEVLGVSRPTPFGQSILSPVLPGLNFHTSCSNHKG